MNEFTSRPFPRPLDTPALGGRIARHITSLAENVRWDWNGSEGQFEVLRLGKFVKNENTNIVEHR